MLGLRFLGNEKAEVQEFPKPVPKDDWMVIRVISCALCGSDLHMRYRPSNDKAYNQNRAIPGHEIVGEVVEVDRIERFKVGDLVSIYPLVTCGKCFYCKHHLWKFCPNKKIIGYDLDGGCAEYITVPERSCVGLPPGFSPDEVCLVWDPIGAPYGAIKRLGVNETDIVAVFGVGPMGLGAVSICSFLGAKVIAVDLIEERLMVAQDLGADERIDSKESNLIEKVLEITEGFGVDVVIECTGKEDVLHKAFQVLKSGGRCALIGEMGKVHEIDVSEEIIHKDLTITGSWMYELEGFYELLSLIEKGLDVKKLVTGKFPLDQAVTAWSTFNTGKTGKIIINP